MSKFILIFIVNTISLCYNKFMNTIVSLATPPGNSGIAVIRISGDSSLDILKQITKSDEDFLPRQMYLRKVYVGEIIDDSLVIYYKAPNSFTGEDVTEIQSHGGYFLSQCIVKECIRLGCIMAEAGEFSKRAFINGKMTIDKAEGIMDLINAENEIQATIGSKLMQGELFLKIKNLQDSLTDILAEIEARLDYPEYEYTQNETTNLKNRLNGILQSLNELILDSESGLKIKNGVKVSIIGSPNVGKSSLLNAITKSNKAIVTDIAGTTRDIVEAEYEYKGIIFRLYDTAGIRESKDIVELIGIERAMKALDDSDLVLKVSSHDNICDISTNKPFIEVFNKSDLNNSCDEKYLYVSAKNNTNIELLKEEIFKQTIREEIKSDKIYLTNLRHIECVKRAMTELNSAIEDFDNTTMDMISSLIKSAWYILGEISGTSSDERIVDRIFEKFCLGK